IHARLEGHLGLIATLGAEDREEFARRSTALVATRATEVLGAVVRAALAGRAAAGSAADAALGLRGEALLGVVLLVVRGMDEVGAAVDTGQGPIGVGHETMPPGARGTAGCASPGPVGPRGIGRSRRRTTLGADLESRVGAHPWDVD